MAVNSRSLKLASFGKRFFVSHIPSPSSSLRRVHYSVYEKNPEELISERAHVTIVPDDVIPTQPDKYWAPHPQTGVFGPAGDQNTASVDNSTGVGPSADTNSVLEQKAFFRPHEDLDKPVFQPQVGRI